MAMIVKHISVDVASENVFQSIIAKQYDSDSRFLTVRLTNEGEQITVSPASTVLINARREDGDAKAFSGTVNEDGTVTVPLTYWMLELDGQVECDISVIDSEQRKLSSTSFTITVDAAAYAGTEVSEDDNYDILVSLIAQCSEMLESGLKMSPDSPPLDAYSLLMGNPIGDGAVYNSGVPITAVNPQMQLLASGTTTEEVANIVINRNDYGDALQITNRIVVFMTVPVATANNYVVLSVNGTGITSAYRGLDTSSQKCVRLEASHCGGGLWAGFSIASSGGTAWDGGGSRPVDMRYPQGEVVTEIKLTSSGTTFPVGTQYQVYGIEVR